MEKERTLRQLLNDVSDTDRKIVQDIALKQLPKTSCRDDNAVEKITLQQLLNNASDSDGKIIWDIALKQLPEASRRDYEAVVRGEKLPSFMSDIVAKKLFDADVHKDRLQYLFRGIYGNDKIIVDSSFRNEGYIQSLSSKKVIFDIAVHFHDGRIGVAEFQVAALDYTSERTEIYGSNLLTIQYSVNSCEKKSEMQYDTVKGALLVYLMKNSPYNFEDFGAKNYIHLSRECSVSKNGAILGLKDKPLVQKAYVQLDKCLEQFLADEDGENNRQFQILLSLLADSNNTKVLEAAQKYPMFKDMIDETRMFVQSKEVQAMLLQEQFEKADLNAYVKHAEKQAEKNILVNLVKEGKLSIEDAAHEANMSIDEFQKFLK